MFLKRLGFTLLPTMTEGSFSPRALRISDIIICCLTYFPQLHPPSGTESNLSGNTYQNSPISSTFKISFSTLSFSISGNRQAQDSKISAFNSPSSPAKLSFLTICLWISTSPTIRSVL